MDISYWELSYKSLNEISGVSNSKYTYIYTYVHIYLAVLKSHISIIENEKRKLSSNSPTSNKTFFSLLQQ